MANEVNDLPTAGSLEPAEPLDLIEDKFSPDLSLYFSDIFPSFSENSHPPASYFAPDIAAKKISELKNDLGFDQRTINTLIDADNRIAKITSKQLKHYLDGTSISILTQSHELPLEVRVFLEGRQSLKKYSGYSPWLFGHVMAMPTANLQESLLDKNKSEVRQQNRVFHFISGLTKELVVNGRMLNIGVGGYRNANNVEESVLSLNMQLPKTLVHSIESFTYYQIESPLKQEASLKIQVRGTQDFIVYYVDSDQKAFTYYQVAETSHGHQRTEVSSNLFNLYHANSINQADSLFKLNGTPQQLKDKVYKLIKKLISAPQPLAATPSLQLNQPQPSSPLLATL